MTFSNSYANIDPSDTATEKYISQNTLISTDENYYTFSLKEFLKIPLGEDLILTSIVIMARSTKVRGTSKISILNNGIKQKSMTVKNKLRPYQMNYEILLGPNNHIKIKLDPHVEIQSIGITVLGDFYSIQVLDLIYLSTYFLGQVESKVQAQYTGLMSSEIEELQQMAQSCIKNPSTSDQKSCLAQSISNMAPEKLKVNHFQATQILGKMCLNITPQEEEIKCYEEGIFHINNSELSQNAKLCANDIEKSLNCYRDLFIPKVSVLNLLLFGTQKISDFISRTKMLVEGILHSHDNQLLRISSACTQASTNWHENLECLLVGLEQIPLRKILASPQTAQKVIYNMCLKAEKWSDEAQCFSESTKQTKLTTLLSQALGCEEISRAEERSRCYRKIYE